MVEGFSIGPRHSVLNPVKRLHIRLGNTTANGIAIVKSAGDQSIGERMDRGQNSAQDFRFQECLLFTISSFTTEHHNDLLTKHTLSTQKAHFIQKIANNSDAFKIFTVDTWHGNSAQSPVKNQSCLGGYDLCSSITTTQINIIKNTCTAMTATIAAQKQLLLVVIESRPEKQNRNMSLIIIILLTISTTIIVIIMHHSSKNYRNMQVTIDSTSS